MNLESQIYQSNRNCNEWNSMETSELDNDVAFVHMICDSFLRPSTIEFNRKKRMQILTLTITRDGFEFLEQISMDSGWNSWNDRYSLDSTSVLNFKTLPEVVATNEVLIDFAEEIKPTTDDLQEVQEAGEDGRPLTNVAADVNSETQMSSRIDKEKLLQRRGG